MNKCPNDNSELVKTTFKGVNVDECQKDGGLFFDQEELDKARNSEDPDLKWIRIDLFEDRDNKFTKYNTHKKCPKDSSEMISLEYPYSKVKIDKCIICDGVWLEKGEFQKIIKFLDNKVNNLTTADLRMDIGRELARLAEGKDDIGTELGDLAVLLKLYEVRLEAEHPSLEKWFRDFVAYWPIH